MKQVQKIKLDANKKITNTSGLVKKTDYNAKITQNEGKIPSITGLATTVSLNAIENNAKLSDTETKYFYTSD